MTLDFPKVARAVTLCVSLSAALGCAATTRSVYEGDVRFEHCYRLDWEERVAVSDKRQCWLDWSDKHTYGQTRDRVVYAAARGRALGQTLAAGATGASIAPLAPAQVPAGPINAFVSPPQTLRDEAKQRRPTPEPAPGASCSDTCGKGWNQCGEECRAEGCRSVCNDSYRSCMKACF